MATRNQVPRANGEGSIGTSIKKWLAGWFGTLNATTIVVSGNISAGTYSGDGSALTGIGSGTGGVINTGSTTIGADSDANGSGEIALQTAGITKAIISNSGNFGIGTVVPGAKLHVSGNIRQDATNELRYYNSAASNWTSIDSPLLAGDANPDFRVRTSSGTLYMGSTGNVGIGMTPTVQFELSGSIGQKASGTAWSNPSDERLKDIQGPADLQRCYDDVKALPLLRYTLKDDCLTPKQATDRTVTGFTANDVQKVIPKAVNVVPFSKVPTLDGEEYYQEEIAAEDGTTTTITKTRPKYRAEVIDDCLNLDMSQVYMQMFGAVQMLQKKVEAMEAEIITIKGI